MGVGWGTTLANCLPHLLEWEEMNSKAYQTIPCCWVKEFPGEGDARLGLASVLCKGQS